MTTIIDRLVVELGFDTKGLTDGQKKAVEDLRGFEEAADKTGRRVSQTGTTISQAFRQVEHPIQALRAHLERFADAAHAPRRALQAVGSQARRTGLEVEDAGKAGAAGFRVLGVAGLAALGTLKGIQSALTGAAVNAQKVFGVGIEAGGAGTSVKEFSAISQALFKHGNVPEADTQSFLVRWQQAQEQAKLGHPEMAVALQQALSIGQVDANVFSDTPEQGIEAIARRFRALTPAQRRAIGDTLGMSPTLSQATGEAGPALPKMIVDARKSAVDDRDTKAANDLVTAQRALDAEWGKLTRMIYDDLTPALINWDKWLTKIVDDVKALFDPSATHEQKMDAYGDIPGTLEWFKRGWQKYAPSWLGGGKQAPGNQPGSQPPANLDLTTDDVAIMQRESKGNPNIGYGGTDLSNVPLGPDGFPIWPGKMGPAGNSTAAGLYQITGSNWHRIAPKLGIHDFSPESQLRVRRELQRESVAAGQPANQAWIASGAVLPVGPVAHPAPTTARPAVKADQVLRAWRKMHANEQVSAAWVAAKAGVDHSIAVYRESQAARTATHNTMTNHNRNTDVGSVHVHVTPSPGTNPYQLGTDVGSAAARAIRATEVNGGQN
jgi:hypothetical protein